MKTFGQQLRDERERVQMTPEQVVAALNENEFDISGVPGLTMLEMDRGGALTPDNIRCLAKALSAGAPDRRHHRSDAEWAQRAHGMDAIATRLQAAYDGQQGRPETFGRALYAERQAAKIPREVFVALVQQETAPEFTLRDLDQIESETGGTLSPQMIIGLSLDIASVLHGDQPSPARTNESIRIQKRLWKALGRDCERRAGRGVVADMMRVSGMQAFMTPLLTDAELAIIDLLAEVNARYFALPEFHPNERNEWIPDLHRLQERIMARAAMRAYPERFTTMVKAEPGELPRRNGLDWDILRDCRRERCLFDPPCERHKDRRTA